MEKKYINESRAQDPELTHQEIADEIKTSRANVHMIEKTALEKLRQKLLEDKNIKSMNDLL